MKTLKLSSMLLVCLVLLFSCTKDTSITNEQDSLNSEYRYGVTGQGGQGNNISVADVAPTMGIEFSSSPAVVGQPVTATAKFTPAAGETAPTCGKLQLQMWVNNDWENVGQVNVSSSNEVSFTFTPTVVGQNAYKFQVHYVSQNCTGYKQNMSEEIFLSVINSCLFGMEGEVTEAFESTPGIFQFTVKYTVQTCSLNFDKFKIQGGLTNGSTYISSTESEHHTPGSSTNQIIKWEFVNAPGVALDNGEKQFSVTFKKAYSGSGAITITGNWSASASWNGVSVGSAEFPAIVYNQ